jgi:hypothetical protein
VIAENEAAGLVTASLEFVTFSVVRDGDERRSPRMAKQPQKVPRRKLAPAVADMPVKPGLGTVLVGRIQGSRSYVAREVPIVIAQRLNFPQSSIDLPGIPQMYLQRLTDLCISGLHRILKPALKWNFRELSNFGIDRSREGCLRSNPPNLGNIGGREAAPRRTPRGIIELLQTVTTSQPKCRVGCDRDGPNRRSKSPQCSLVKV